MRISIRAKILIFFAATLVITGALNLFFISQVLKKDYTAALDAELLVLGSNLQTQLKRITSLGISTRDIEGFNQQCLELVEKNEQVTQAMVIDRQGVVIFHNDLSRRGERLLHKGILSSIAEGRTEVYSVTEENGDIFFAVLPFGDMPGQSEYAVIVTSPAKIINDKIFRLIGKCNIILLAIFSLAAILLLTSLTTILTIPLTVILNTMRDITKTRNLQKRVDIKAHDEIGQIADAFNQMTADLQHSTTSIDNLNLEVAERKKTEDALRKSEEFTKRIIESSSDCIKVLDLEGNLLSMSGGGQKLLEINDISPYLNKSFIDFWKGKDRDGALEAISKAKQDEIGIFYGYFETAKATPKWWEVIISPIKDADGSINRLLAVSRDITERKKAEEKLTELLSLHTATLESTADGILVVDLNGKVANYNKKFLQLWRIPESLAESNDDNKLLAFVLDQLVDPEQFLAGVRRLYSHPEEQLIKTLEFRDGRIFERYSQPHRIGSEIAGRVWCFRDVTRQKEAEKIMKELNLNLKNTVAELESANEEMKNFAFIASHDLKEPLRKITAFGSILKSSLGNKLDEDDAENLQFVIEGAARMTKMVEGLLVYSRVNTQMQPVQPVDLDEIVTHLQQFELAMLIEEKHVTIESQSLPCVVADPAQIRQLMQNLIANGIKYQKKGNAPHITITGKPAADGMVRIKVTDNGIGIKPEFQGTIFTMFKRLHSRDEYDGTGIGLAVCKKIVERHGGKIGIESQPDKGSTFWFTIPAAKVSLPGTNTVQASVSKLN